MMKTHDLTCPASNLLSRLNFDVLAQAVEWLSAEQGSPGRFGGVLAIAVVYPESATSYTSHFASRSVGLPGLRFGSFAKNAAEKIYRLRERRMKGNEEVASSESADPNNENPDLRTYGGCIVFSDKTKEAFISFSGAPAEVDEPIAFVLGEMIGLPIPADYSNPLIPRARELLKRVLD